MKILVCGGRHYSDKIKVFTMLSTISATHGITSVAHGGATGADELADCWAREFDKPLAIFRANWAAEGRGAGPRRNQRMLEQFKPDVVVAFPGGRGTADMVRRAQAAGVHVVTVV